MNFVPSHVPFFSKSNSENAVKRHQNLLIFDEVM